MKREKPVYTASGTLEGEMVVAFLASKGIDAFVSQESIGSVHGLTAGILGRAKIYVRDEDREQALHLLEGMDAGEFELPDDVDLAAMLDEEESELLLDDIDRDLAEEAAIEAEQEDAEEAAWLAQFVICLLYTSPSPRD